MHPQHERQHPVLSRAVGPAPQWVGWVAPSGTPQAAQGMLLLSSSHTHGVPGKTRHLVLVPVHPPPTTGPQSVSRTGGPVADDVPHCKGETTQPTLPELHPCQRSQTPVGLRHQGP